ncbi:MAG: hypothetical protein Q8N02_08410 [Methylotenera sp.]|nr:hypothetical protein [Methylotenera sp.]MDO9234017.1 hypothetical protein [Methylotenera sp.]MDO9389976.1 hypothetical protein [Methylotenera sp.]MDP2101776.1 hypothetical protein [Methylotenera sp.]MDP2281408.1 hypothetical protein [Methylotenera sp.]
MFLALNKKSLWTIVIWFAVLQTFSPFIHGHFEADSPAQGVGLHIHMPAFEQTITLASDKVHVLQNASNTIHTVGIDKALIKSVDLLPPPVFSVLLVLFLFVLATKFISISVARLPSLSLYLRPQSKPRAPPFS